MTLAVPFFASRPMAFQLPKDGAIYTESIFGRCRDLIGYDAWSGIAPHRLDTWINNFRTPEEDYFAACVLDGLIYRSNAQTVALMQQLFQRAIPDLARSNTLSPGLSDLYYSLRNGEVDPRVRVVPVIPPGESPAKSGATIARMFRRQLGFHEQWIAHPDEIPSLIGDVDSFVFVDDFLGTGTQFSIFLSDTGLPAHFSSACFIYAPLAGHVTGISDIHSAFANLHIVTVELLDDGHALFSPMSRSFNDGVNSPDDSRQLYYDLLEDRQIKIDGPDRRGFGHFELAYAFEHAIPDNSLPILWWRDSEVWQPLFDR